MNTRQSALVVMPALVLANLAMLFIAVVQEAATGFPEIVLQWSLVPIRLTDSLLNGGLPEIAHNLATFVTYAFLHGGFDHFFNNMLLLVILGFIVEKEVGSARFLAIYSASGILGALAHYTLHAFSPLPMLGASGAIAGIMAAFVVVVFGLRQPVTLLRLLGVMFVGQWLLEQVLSVALTEGAQRGVAYTCHLGGFIGGLLISIAVVRTLRARARAQISRQTSREGQPEPEQTDRSSNEESGEKPDRLL